MKREAGAVFDDKEIKILQDMKISVVQRKKVKAPTARRYLNCWANFM